MSDLPELPPRAFDKADPTSDLLFYREPRLVAHIDDRAIVAVTELYRETLPPGGVMLDLMGSWISHLPQEVEYAEVIGHGMNAEELAANPRYDRWFIQDLNADPALPLDRFHSGWNRSRPLFHAATRPGSRERDSTPGEAALDPASVDAAAICVAIQYLQQPVAVLQDVRRVLRPGAPVVITFSNRCFPTKAVAIWQALDGADQCRLVELYLTRAGFTNAASRKLPSRGDPVWAVIGYA